MSVPSLSEVESANWDYLKTSAETWTKLADQWESAFTEVRDASVRPGGTEWVGPAADAVQHRTDGDVVRVRGPAEQLREAGAVASRGFDQQEAGKRLVLDAVDETRRDGFKVADDYSVTDTKTSYDSTEQRDQRQKDAEGHSDFIKYRVRNLVSGEDEIAHNLGKATEGLDTFGFPDEGSDGGAGATGAGVDGPGAPPDDPKQFADWWQSLSQEQKDWMYSHDHFIGNHPGMPFEDKTLFNERHLPELIANAQSNVDAMQARYDQLARQVYMGDQSVATGSEMAALGPKLQAAKHSLAEYQGVQNAMNAPPGTPKRYLGVLDDKGHAAVSIGNPDTASHNAILVPGTGDDLTQMGGSVGRSQTMYDAAMLANPNARVAVTTWTGYDRPMSVTGQAPWPSYAQHGAAALDSFDSGMRASRIGAPSIDTVIGHSYGTTLVGAAASGGHQLAADNVIAVASPGMLVDHAGDLNINPGGTVYAMTDPHDPIGPANLFTQFTLGPDPMGADFGAQRLLAGSGVGSGPGGIFPNPDVHGSYWHPDTPAIANLGAVIAGVPAPFPAGP